MNHIDYINKEVNFNYKKKNLKFALSQALFSSFNIDAGTNKLLVSIAKEMDFSRIKSVLDVGCGVGVIGIAMGKACNLDNLVLQDRDALAACFSRFNGEKNGIENGSYNTNLALEGLGDNKFDLITSNIPAKAGDKVIIDFLSRSGSFLTETGTCAVVIVKTLADFAESILKNSGCEILHKEYNTQYTIFHYRGFNRDYKLNPEIYTRETMDFDFDNIKYTLKTTYNTPDFDNLSFQTELGMAMLSTYRLKGKGLFINPGQGHIPVYLSLNHGNDLGRIDVAGRDSLRNFTSNKNLKLNKENINSDIYNIPFIDSLEESIKPESLDFIGLEIEPTPKTNWDKIILPTPLKLLKSGGLLFISGKSGAMHVLLKSTKGFSPIEDRKHRGFRAVILKKN